MVIVKNMSRRLLRWAGFLWALPITLPALMFVVLLRPSFLNGGVRWARIAYGDTVALAVWGGVLGCILKRMPLGSVNGITFGHVVLFRQHWCIRAIGAHEFDHVRQYSRWGVFFPLAYVLNSAWQWLRGRHYYWDNHFEVSAYRYERERFTRLTRKN